MCTCLDHKLDLCGQDAVHAHVQLSRAYLMSTFDVTHGIKCTRLSPSLAGRAWERGLLYMVVLSHANIYVNNCLQPDRTK